MVSISMVRNGTKIHEHAYVEDLFSDQKFAEVYWLTHLSAFPTFFW